MLDERLRDGENPRVLTTDGEAIVRELFIAYDLLRGGEMVHGDRVRTLLDAVMNSPDLVSRPVAIGDSARSQERAETLTTIGAAAGAAPK